MNPEIREYTYENAKLKGGVWLRFDLFTLKTQETPLLDLQI